MLFVVSREGSAEGFVCGNMAASYGNEWRLTNLLGSGISLVFKHSYLRCSYCQTFLLTKRILLFESTLGKNQDETQVENEL